MTVKTGKGRARAQVRILHVTHAICPMSGDQSVHRLTNTRDAVTFCVYCGKSWSDLDQELRSK